MLDELRDLMKAYIFTALATAVVLTACASAPQSQSTHQGSPVRTLEECQRMHPKPTVTADNFGSAEQVEWLNRLKACQHGR